MRRFPQDPRQRAGRQPPAAQQQGGRGPQAPLPPAGRFPQQPVPQQQPMGQGAPVGRGFPMQQSHIQQQQQQQQRGGPMPMQHGRGGNMNGRGGMNGRGPPGGPIMGGRGGGRHGPVGPAFQQAGRFQQQQQPQHNNVMMMGRGAPPPPPPPPGNVVGGRFGPIGGHGHGRGPGPGPNFQQGRHQHQSRMMGRGNMHIQAPPPPPPIQQHQQPYSAQIQPPFQQQQQLQNPNNYGNPGMRPNQVMPLQQGNAMPPIMHQPHPPPQQQPQYPPTAQQFPQNVNNRFTQPQSQQMIPMSSQQVAPVPSFHAASNSNQLQHQQQQQQQQQQQRSRYQPQGVSVSPAKVSTAYAKGQLDQAWSEHANKGVKYYYNSVSKQSTFDRPAVMDILPQYQVPAKSAMAVVGAAAAAVASTAGKAVTKDAKPQAWAEYTDASTGKKYYSNGVTTTWERPEEFLTPEDIVAKSKQKEEDAAASVKAASLDSASKKRKRADKETPFRNHEEAVAAFKGLMLAKGIAPTNKWNEVVKMCSADPRWDDCEAMLSTGERKQAMAEYQTRRANELRTQERQERARAKDAFLKLLSEVVPKLPGFSVWNSRFSDIREALARDERFHTVAVEGTRESLYLDFCEELRKHDERKKRNKKKEAQDAFISFLREKEEAGVLLFSSTWNNFLSSLEESDKKDNRFKLSAVLVESDRQLYFADFLTELQTSEDEKRRRIREAQRRAEKAQRDAYRDALERAASEGKITPSSHWRDAERVIESENTYSLVLEQDREAPREIFEAFIEEWEDVYRRDCQFLSQLVHPTSNREILVTVDTKYDAFVKALLEEAKSSPQTLAEARRITKASAPVSSARVYFNELAKTATEKHATPLRRGRNGARRASLDGSSSEDEGEIKEDEDEDEETDTNKKERNDEELPNQDDGGTTSTTTPVSNGKSSANGTKEE